MPTTRERVPINTAEEVNERIRHSINRNVEYYSAHRDLIPCRLRELDEEWDIERAIQSNAAVVGLFGLAFSLRSRLWLIVPALVSGLLLQHALQGWCPPVPVLRRLGFRTTYEIEDERQRLRALRGDFQETADSGAETESSARKSNSRRPRAHA